VALAAGFLLTAGIGLQAPRTISSHESWLSVTVYSARPTKRGLALYTFTVVRESYDSKAQRYAEDKRTESNCIRTGKSEAYK